MKFGEKLLYLRTRDKMSQEELAGVLGVSRQSISKWEVGDTLPEIDKILEISEHFNVSLDCLLKENQSLTSDDGLDRMVIKFLNSAKDMHQISDDLIEIARDGIIDDDEKIQLEEILKTLESITAIVEELKLRAN